MRLKAPLEKVFEAYIKEEVFVKWFCRGNQVKVNKFEGKMVVFGILKKKTLKVMSGDFMEFFMR
ncbi:hypothetical protein HC766_04585 [Candidatus Gracilibacteria bacterium]|nr:hypothetical protein [Candidatus Gracilibacteria bacterium]